MSTERVFNVRPAYDCIGVQPCVHGSETCKPGTGGSHGRHNAELHLTVRGPDAEVTLVMLTGWDLPTVPPHHRISRDGGYPKGAFVEIHTARPRYESQDGGAPRPDGTCKDWAACYLDAGYSMSDEPTRLLVEQGSDAAWAWLENLHNDVLRQVADVAEARSVMTLSWQRLEPGCYVAGPYRVVKGITNWHAYGPGGETVGVQHVHRTKAAAQQACAEAHAYNQARAIAAEAGQ